MTKINDQDQFLFQEAGTTLLTDFTDSEMARIHEIARELRALLEFAKAREQARLSR